MAVYPSDPFSFLFDTKKQHCYLVTKKTESSRVFVQGAMRDKAGSSSSSSSSMRSSRKEKAQSSSKGSKSDLARCECGRREKMTHYYKLLQSMVPSLHPRATRADILDETISYIKSLEETVAALESQKKAMQLQRTVERGSSISMTVSDRTAFFALRAIRRPRLLTQVLQVFNKHRAQVLATTVADADYGGLINVTVTASMNEDEESSVEKIRVELMTL